MATTKAEEMIAWAEAWAESFTPYVEDDNEWYRRGGIDGKDAGDLGEGLAEVARLLSVAQDRIAALARDRALLLAYAKAEHALNEECGPAVDRREVWDGLSSEWYEARQALLDAGLLAGDDDGQ